MSYLQDSCADVELSARCNATLPSICTQSLSVMLCGVWGSTRCSGPGQLLASTDLLCIVQSLNQLPSSLTARTVVIHLQLPAHLPHFSALNQYWLQLYVSYTIGRCLSVTISEFGADYTSQLNITE